MPFEKFDKSKLILKDLNEREHDLDISIMQDISVQPEPFNNPNIDILVDRIKEARRKNATVMMMMGAHVIRAGAAPWLIKLMEEGLITHFALNGAGAIHDFEFALIGATTESVAKYISQGQFGIEAIKMAHGGMNVHGFNGVSTRNMDTVEILRQLHEIFKIFKITHAAALIQTHGIGR